MIVSTVGVGVRGMRVGRRVAVAVAVAVAVGVNVGVGVAEGVAVAVNVAVAVDVAVGGSVATPTAGTVGTSRPLELFKRSLMMKPASKAMSATKLIASGARHDRCLACTSRPGETIDREADVALVITMGDAITTARSVGIAASRASNSSNVLPNRSAGEMARHFCTICSS